MSDYINVPILAEDLTDIIKTFDKLKSPRLLRIKMHPFFYDALVDYYGYAKSNEFYSTVYSIPVEEDLTLTKPFDFIYDKN